MLHPARPVFSSFLSVVQDRVSLRLPVQTEYACARLDRALRKPGDRPAIARYVEVGGSGGYGRRVLAATAGRRRNETAVRRRSRGGRCQYPATTPTLHPQRGYSRAVERF